MTTAKKQQWPEVRDISANDLIEIIGAGFKDFRNAPKYGMFFAGIYVLAGWLIMAMLFQFGLHYLAYPLAMGFALVAPFAGVAFYAVSDKLEKGEPLSWNIVFGAIKDSIKRDVRWMALVTGFALVIWLDLAAVLFFSFMGLDGFGPDFLEKLFFTTNGLTFLIVGNTAGALIAFFVFSISVISFPMLYDRDIDFVTGMVTSVRLVNRNTLTMLIWCVIIGLLTAASLATAFLGFLIVLPVVGHASWHLYRRAVEPAVVAG
ncbi:MAG: DUF2189 domain-containing protein [Filomicrobium sp.]